MFTRACILLLDGVGEATMKVSWKLTLHQIWEGEKGSAKREGRSLQEEKSRNKGVENTGTLGNHQWGDLRAEYVGGAGWLEMPAGTRSRSLPDQTWAGGEEPEVRDQSLYSAAGGEALTCFKWISSVFTKYVASLGGWWVLSVYWWWCLNGGALNELDGKQAT